jgi:hypothetical protein
VSEWLKEPVSKTGIPVRVSWVRIPPCPFLRATFGGCCTSGVVLALVGASRSQAPNAKESVSAAKANRDLTDLKQERNTLLKYVAVSGPTVYDDNITLHPNNPAGSAGPAFSGTVTITQFAYDQVGGLRVSGVVKDASGAEIKRFENIAATLVSRGAPTAPFCSILDLDIGAIHLDLLGLVVDLAPIHLDIRGETGPGRLLGNLLCALAGLLDPPGPLAAILDLIDRINRLLA